MARMSIPKVMEAYRRQDAAGYGIGMRAFTRMSTEDLYETTKNFVKYENKRIRSMIDKGYVTPAILQYAKAAGRYDADTAQEIRRTEGREAYLQYIRRSATIYMPNVSQDAEGNIRYSRNTQSREEMMDKLQAAITFKLAKTSTIRGEKAAQKKTAETLKAKYGLGMRGWTADDKAAFWDALHEAASRGRFADEWNLSSTRTLQEISERILTQRYKDIDTALREIDRYDRMLNDLSEEGLDDMAGAFQLEERQNGLSYDNLLQALLETQRLERSGEFSIEDEFNQLQELEW